ncbi:MAG: PAS domain-containing protein, partial [Planctomycetales bacterium]
MAITLIVVSTLLQFAAAAVALRLARASRRLALLALALAILLMGLRRAYSLHGALSLGRPLDLGAETIALAVSLLMFVGVLGASRWLRGFQAASLATNAPESSTWIQNSSCKAVLMGAVAVGASCAAGWLAFENSRRAATETIRASNLDFARVLGAHAENLEGSKSRPEILASLASLWERIKTGDSKSYLCVIDSNARLLLHTRNPRLVGSDVGGLPIDDERRGQVASLRQLARDRQDGAGRFTTLGGERQIVSFAHADRVVVLLVVHVPAEPVEAAVRATNAPWIVGNALVVFLFLPAALGFMHWACAGSLAERRRAEEELRESEQRFRRAVVEAPNPVMIHAEDGEVLQISRRWSELAGHAPEEIPTIAAWTKLAYGEERTEIQARIERLFELDCRVDEGEFPVAAASGEQRIWDFCSAPLGMHADGRRLV